MSTIVTIASELEPLVPDFLINRRKDLEELRGHLNHRNMKMIVHVVHRFTGACDAYGFNEMAQLGAEIEKGAILGDMSSLSCSLAELDTYITNLQVLFDESQVV